MFVDAEWETEYGLQSLPEAAPETAGHSWPELRGFRDIPKKGALSPAKRAELRHGYFAATSYLDTCIAQVLDVLDVLQSLPGGSGARCKEPPGYVTPAGTRREPAMLNYQSGIDGSPITALQSESSPLYWSGRPSTAEDPIHWGPRSYGHVLSILSSTISWKPGGLPIQCAASRHRTLLGKSQGILHKRLLGNNSRGIRRFGRASQFGNSIADDGLHLVSP